MSEAITTKEQVKDDGILVFSSAVAKQLIQDRFPTTYLGVRRMRASCREVAQAAAGKLKKTAKSDVVFKIVDKETGEERRMTSQEKKQHKRLVRAADRKRRLEEVAGDESNSRQKLGDDDQGRLEEDNTDPETRLPRTDEGRFFEEETVSASAAFGKEEESEERQSQPQTYMQLKVDLTQVADEISDLRGEREGVPPVFIPPPIVRLLSPERRLKVKVDDDWADAWASQLKAAFQPAEFTRRKESMRPMPYHLVPEIWTRLRPANFGASPLQTEQSFAIHDSIPTTIRPDSVHDKNVAAILQLIHVGTGLHLSCGAKFGCDYLLYDGPRSQRHAFAGLRIIENMYPSAYDLSGYVRTLNTAGKLALLACAKQENDTYRVAIIDLALVKIAETTFRKPKKTMEQRLQNLAK